METPRSGSTTVHPIVWSNHRERVSMKKYRVYEQKAYLVKVATGVVAENLRQYGEVESEIMGNYKNTEFKDGKVVGLKLVNGLKQFYAFEET